MFTQQYYKAIAEIIKKANEDYNGGTPADMLLMCIKTDLADYFEQDNPNFDRDKFIAACGVE